MWKPHLIEPSVYSPEAGISWPCSFLAGWDDKPDRSACHVQHKFLEGANTILEGKYLGLHITHMFLPTLKSKCENQIIIGIEFTIVVDKPFGEAPRVCVDLLTVCHRPVHVLINTHSHQLSLGFVPNITVHSRGLHLMTSLNSASMYGEGIASHGVVKETSTKKTYCIGTRWRRRTSMSVCGHQLRH